MSKRQKKSRKSSSSRKNQAKPLSLEAQEQKTRDLLAAEKYKEASESCKILLKQENRPEWLELLSNIYHGRAYQLASKGMHKEAVMIWRNRAELCGQQLVDGFYFRTLLAAGMVEQAMTLYQQHQTDFEQQGVLAEIRERMAAISLTQSSDFLKTLPEDDVMVKDYQTAMTALQAYCDAEDDLLKTQLAKISFRSPFRDLRQILKALSTTSDDNSAATKLLDRISADSPFKLLAEAAQTSLLPDNQLFADFSKFKPEFVQLIAAQHDIKHNLPKFYNELHQLGDSPAAEPFMRFIIRHREMLGVDYARYAALRLLLQTPKSLSAFIKAFGKISELEQSKVEAWNLEKAKAHPLQILDAWEDIEQLLQPDDCDSTEDYLLSLALLGRHELEQLDRLGDAEDMEIPVLEKIVKNDPQDHASYLRLIASLREQGDMKKARRFLDQALKIFPDDIAILTEAVETALASKAYKKATGLAAQILEKDPINTRVRSSLIDAHLSHSRKLIKQNKYTLADKELGIANNWARTEKDKAKVDLVRGSLLLDLKQPAEAAAIWNMAKDTLGGELCGQFYLLQELICQERHVEAAIKAVKIKQVIKPSSKETLLNFCNLLKTQYKKSHSEEVFAVLTMLESSISQAIKFKYSASEFELICEITDQFGLDNLLHSYVKKARKQWPKEIVFEYYEILAKTEVIAYLSDRDFDRLEVLRDLAYKKGDTGLTHKIEMLLSHFDMPPYFEPDIDDELEELPTLDNLDGLVDMLLNAIPANELKRMKREMSESELREFAKNMILQDLPDMNDDEDEFDMFPPPPTAKKKKAKTKKKATPNKQLDLF